VPDLPIVTIAKATAQVALGDTSWTPIVKKADRERWNDWGIGMLLQGDIRGAEYAFHRVTEADPAYADGWLNIGRALIQEGETDAARPYVEKALKLAPGLARAQFFLAMSQKAAGDYDGAVSSLRATIAQYPRDRVVLNQLGRILFLQRKYSEAVTVLRSVFDVDPEDLQAHYTLMLAYRGLERDDLARREEQLFLRFKADESAQALTEMPRLMNPEDNNERQQIHDHVTDYTARAVAAVVGHVNAGHATRVPSR
jgi:Flp pilus assembly protein TadD